MTKENLELIHLSIHILVFLCYLWARHFTG